MYHYACSGGVHINQDCINNLRMNDVSIFLTCIQFQNVTKNMRRSRRKKGVCFYCENFTPYCYLNNCRFQLKFCLIGETRD